MRTLAYDKDALETAVKSARIAKSAIDTYAKLTGETITAAKRKLIVDRFNRVEEERMEFAVRFETARMKAREEHAEAFKPVLAQYQNKVQTVMSTIFIPQTAEDLAAPKFVGASSEINLTENRLSIKLRMPAFWCDVAGLTVDFMKFRKASEITADVIEIDYGFGGHNAGFTPIEVATQKANAILAMCKAAKAVAEIDWTPFVGFYEAINERQREILAAEAA